MGADFNYRDIYFNNRVYDVLLNLTPGIKWNMGHRWEVAAQVFVPVVNQYGDRYKKVRLNMAVLSKTACRRTALENEALRGIIRF